MSRDMPDYKSTWKSSIFTSKSVANFSMSPMARQRILRTLGVFRPTFRNISQNLKDVDLVLVEEYFERLLLDYDRVFTSMAIPACLWKTDRRNLPRQQRICRPHQRQSGGITRRTIPGLPIPLISGPSCNIRIDGRRLCHQLLGEVRQHRL